MLRNSTKALVLLVIGTLTGAGIYRTLELSKVGKYVDPSPYLTLDTTTTPSIAALHATHADVPYSAAAKTSLNAPTPSPSFVHPQLPLKTIPKLDFATNSESSNDTLALSTWAQVVCVPGQRQRSCIDPTLLAKASGRDLEGRRSAKITASGSQRSWLCEVLVHWALESSAAASSSSHEVLPLLATQQHRANQIKAVTELCSSSDKTAPPSLGAFQSSNPSSVVAVALHDGLGNQMFQVLFGRLLANDLGAELVVFDASEAKHQGKGRGKGTAKRSAGAAAILVALFPNLGAQVVSSLSNSSTAHACLRALQSRGAWNTASSQTPSSAESAPFTLGRVTDTDRLWRAWGHSPGPKGRLEQLQASWVFSDGDDAATHNRASACVLVDGFFQSTALYERRHAYVKHLFHIETTPEPTAVSSLRPLLPPPAADTAAGKTSPSRRATSGVSGGRSSAAASWQNQWIHHPMLGSSPLRAPNSKDAVVHLRTCEANRGSASDLRKSFYPALPASYYESILNATPWERAWLVGPPVCLKGATARRLSRAFPGKMVLVHSPTPPKMDPRRGPQLRQTGAAAEVGPWQEWEPTFGVIADVLFMRAAPGVLILGLGSFSFWAGWLNDQPNTQVHIPLAGRQTQYHLANVSDRAGQPRVTYHQLH